MKSCVFVRNIALDAVAILNSKGGNSKIQNCIFSMNNGKDGTGALHSEGTNIKISHSYFSHNVGSLAGAIYFSGKLSALFIQGSNISHNNLQKNITKLPSSGCAIVMQSGSHLSMNSVTIQHNSGAGGLILGVSSAKITNSEFRSNMGYFGGAIAAMLSTINDSYDKLTIANTSFIENRGSGGTALVLNHRHIIILNCYFYSANCTTSFIEVNTTLNTIFRSYANVFVISPEDLELPFYLVVFSSNIQDNNRALLYCWQTWYQDSNSTTYPVDKILTHKTSSQHVVLANVVNANLTTQFSQYASGRYSTLCVQKA